MSILQLFLPSLLILKPNKLDCLYLAITFQSSLIFAGSLPKEERSERCSNWVGSGLALKFQDLAGKGRTNPLAYLASSSVTKEKSFITLTHGHFQRTVISMLQVMSQCCYDILPNDAQKIYEQHNDKWQKRHLTEEYLTV